ncbi:TPA: hypothetical protein HIE77_004661 [Escherichia coli]|nr:hypothetical protein [Escherichia coli]
MTSKETFTHYQPLGNSDPAHTATAPGGLSAKAPVMTPLMLDTSTRKLVAWDGTTDGAAVGILAVEVDMGRSAANNITQSGGTEWSKRDKSTYDPTDDIEAYALNASGVVNIIVFDPKGWALFRSFKAVREKLDTRRGSHSELETAVKDLGKAVSYKGMYGDVAIVVYSGQYVENGVKKNFLPDNTMVLGNTHARGLRTYGCIQDADAQREGINASARYLLTVR